MGDDIKSQVGATIVHRQLARLMRERGVKLAHTSQLNFGGNTDFLNMLERERLESKKISKTNAVTSIMGDEIDKEDIHIGPSDYVPWLTDRKWAHIRLEGTGFGDVPINIELKLEVWDSPNSAGIVIDAVRCAKLGARPRHRRHAGGTGLLLHEEPAVQHPDSIAHELTEAFIAGESDAVVAPSVAVHGLHGRPSRRPRRLAPRRPRRRRARAGTAPNMGASGARDRLPPAPERGPPGAPRAACPSATAPSRRSTT